MANTQPGLVRRIQADTVRLAYRTWGPDGAPPLVLLHALGEQSSDWAPVAQALASSWRVYTPDLRGHGASDWAGPYTIEQLARDLAALLDALDLGKVVTRDLCGRNRRRRHNGGCGSVLHHPQRRRSGPGHAGEVQRW